MTQLTNNSVKSSSVCSNWYLKSESFKFFYERKFQFNLVLNINTTGVLIGGNTFVVLMTTVSGNLSHYKRAYNTKNHVDAVSI
jgi:hypothetical protein